MGRGCNPGHARGKRRRLAPAVLPRLKRNRRNARRLSRLTQAEASVSCRAYFFGACPAIFSYNCPRLSWALA